jgi:hypothetical protein
MWERVQGTVLFLMSIIHLGVLLLSLQQCSPYFEDEEMEIQRNFVPGMRSYSKAQSCLTLSIGTCHLLNDIQHSIIRPKWLVLIRKSKETSLVLRTNAHCISPHWMAHGSSDHNFSQSNSEQVISHLSSTHNLWPAFSHPSWFLSNRVQVWWWGVFNSY